MQRSKCKNANPKKVETRGFSRCPNLGFGFGKMSRLPGFFKTHVSIPSSNAVASLVVVHTVMVTLLDTVTPDVKRQVRYGDKYAPPLHTHTENQVWKMHV